MNIGYFALVLILTVSPAVMGGDSPTTPTTQPDRDDRELSIITKDLPDHRQLAVVQGPKVAMADFLDVYSNEMIGQALWAAPIRLELRRARGKPIVLWSRLKPEVAGLPGFDVLDMQVEPDRILMVTGECGGIILWKIDLLDNTCVSTSPRCDDWNGIGAAVPYNRDNVKAKIVAASKDRKLTVEFETLGKTLKSFGRYEQVGEEWKFALVGPTFEEREKKLAAEKEKKDAEELKAAEKEEANDKKAGSSK